ncbi:MAG: flagellar hook-length control protein FliK [Lachnospiraceae bacterium]|nr:flagellar hook-length control protein FliK [Lachnospiraceae bacterium]
MQISDFNISANTGKPILTNTPVQGNQPAVSMGNISGNAQITQAAEGQLFRGQILNITGDQVNILMEGNQTLLAHMGESVNLNIGDAITFQVKENNGTNVTIKPFAQSADMMKDNAIFKVLDVNNLSPTAKNYQIAESLMNNNMAVDKGSMQRIMQQSYKYPDASIDTLVSMNKLGIPVTESSIGQFEAFMSNNHQLVNNMNGMSQSILNLSANVLNDISSSASSNPQATLEILEFNQTLLSAISDEGDIADPNLFKTGETVTLNDVPALSNGATLTEGMVLGEQTVASTADFTQQNLQMLSDKTGLTPETLNNIFDSLRNMGIPEEHIQKLADDSHSSMKLLNNINELLKQTNDSDISATDIKAFFQTEEYKELLKSGIKEKFTLDGNNMKSPQELDELYNKMYEKTNNLAEAFGGKGGSAGEQLSNSAKGMQERLDFIQNLNNMFSYAQIPVKLGNNEMNSELFVYMNKKKLSENKEDVSALLHLDMDHLGPTDVHVSLRGGMVNTRFYVEDEVSAKILDEHMTILEKAVNEAGFSLKNEVITREPSIATSGSMVVDEMFGVDLEQSVKRYSFDIRM